MPIQAQETPTKDSLLKTRLLSDSEDALWGNDSASSAETGRRAPEMPPEIRGPVPGRPGESQLRGMPTLPPPPTNYSLGWHPAGRHVIDLSLGQGKQAGSRSFPAVG